VRGEGRSEQRGQCRHRSVHQPRQSGLHDLEHEQAPPRLFLLLARATIEDLLLETLCDRFVATLGLGQIAEQLAHARVRGPFHGPLVEALRLELHDLGLLPHRVEAERTDHPYRPARDEPLHVLPPQERDVLTEFLAVKLDQPAAVGVLFTRHLGEHLGRSGVIVLQALGIIGVNAGILFLKRDGEGKDLLFGQVRESLHGDTSGWIDLELF
jgi:hypothetical protein